MGIPKRAILFAGYLILILSLVLMEASHGDDYTEREYTHNGVRCASCGPGMRVSQHCTLHFSTLCEKCPDGEYSDRYSGSEKCLKCKSCDQELGLQIKKSCTATHNTVCGPREGCYCIDICTMARKHKVCPPGEGVKENGTPFKDIVCEICPNGTFSSEDSTIEECMNWTVCETHKLKPVEPGSAKADVKCEVLHDWVLAIHVVVMITLFGILLGVVGWYLKNQYNYKRGYRNLQETFRNDSDEGKMMQPLREEDRAV